MLTNPSVNATMGPIMQRLWDLVRVANHPGAQRARPTSRARTPTTDLRQQRHSHSTTVSTLQHSKFIHPQAS